MYLFIEDFFEIIAEEMKHGIPSKTVKYKEN